MAGLILCSPILSDAGTLVASSQVTTMEASHLQEMRPSLKWRSTSLTPNLVGNLGSAKTIRYVSLRYTNAKASTTWRVRFATSEANLTAAPSYDSTSVSLYPGGVDLSSWLEKFSRWYDATGKTVTWYRIDIDHSASGDSYFEAGRLFVSEGVAFTTGVAVYPFGSFIEEAVVETEDQAGEESPRSRRKRRSLTVHISGLSDADALGKLNPLLADRGSSKDILMDAKTEEATYPHGYIVTGRIKEARPVLNTFYNNWELDVSVVEL